MQTRHRFAASWIWATACAAEAGMATARRGGATEARASEPHPPRSMTAAFGVVGRGTSRTLVRTPTMEREDLPARRVFPGCMGARTLRRGEGGVPRAAARRARSVAPLPCAGAPVRVPFPLPLPCPPLSPLTRPLTSQMSLCVSSSLQAARPHEAEVPPRSLSGAGAERGPGAVPGPRSSPRNEPQPLNVSNGPSLLACAAS